MRGSFTSLTNREYGKHAYFLWLLFLLCYSGFHIDVTESKLIAQFSENGIEGVISFKAKISDGIVSVSTSVKLIGSKDAQDIRCSWNIHQFPVDYSNLENRCTEAQLGPVVVNLDPVFGQLTVNKDLELSASSDVLPLTGFQGIWYGSLLIQLPNGKSTCSTLMIDGDEELKIAAVKFYGPVFGTVYIFWMGVTGSLTDTMILTDLQHLRKGEVIQSKHKWAIFAADNLSSSKEKIRLPCNALQYPYNGMNDLSTRLRPLQTGSKATYRDDSLDLTDLYQNQHSYYLVIYDDVHPDVFLTCAPISVLSPLALRATLELKGVKNRVILSQKTTFEPTVVNITLASMQHIGGFRIHELPPKPKITVQSKSGICAGIKDVYNPTKKNVGADAKLSESSTQDEYAVGDISGKIGYSGGSKVDNFLSLYGSSSVLHRSFVVYRNAESGVEEPWICATLLPVKDSNFNIRLPMRSAEVIFRYPLAGRIVFRQLADEVISDTVIIVESLVYSDGSSLLNSFHHNWTIAENSPGNDYYSWQNRCLSTGDPFNPYKVSAADQAGSLMAFNFGQLSSILGTLAVAGETAKSEDVSRTLFIHPNLQLQGEYSIAGKSVVIFDENGPKARGNRLACGRIIPINRRKAVVRDWFGNGFPVSITGKVEMYQYSEYDTVDMEVDLEGLQRNGNYHIHVVPVEEELEFPCENSTLYEIWNPFNVSTDSHNQYSSAKRTPDEYMVGDLSGKFGTLDNLSMLEAAYNDTNLHLFGHVSAIGRSVIVHESQTHKRWACATIERGYAPSEARELRAIASFHHPNGYAYGYMRMSQLVHTDGSKSETVIEVNLRHPGKQNRNVTRNHLWMIYVNPVTVDATVAAQHTRCTAGGYVWNPYFTQLADPVNEELYFRECGPDNPLRCYLGDVSGRLGPITIGAERAVFSDRYLSLEGEDSIIGRSVVILDKNFGNDRFACANIQPDKDIIKYVNVRKTPNFVPTQFLSDVRDVLGIPEWMLTADSRKTKTLHSGACVQFLLHFKGPEANKIELDFSRLMRTGRISAPSLYIPGYVSPRQKKIFAYTECPVREDLKKKSTDSSSFSLHSKFWILPLQLTLSIVFTTV